MKQLILILAIIGLAIADCNYDNCLRAVSGTRRGPGQSSTASSDCSTFMQTTISQFPFLTTVTTTITLPPSKTANAKLLNRAAMATIPAYATPCTDAAEYSSACSCIGVTGATVTAPQTTLTTTLTITVRPTPTPAACQGQTCSTGFDSCNDGGGCFCFSRDDGSGVCAGNAVCDELPLCLGDIDCDNGGVCAFETCCPTDGPGEGVCLSAGGGVCENEGLRMVVLAKGMGKGTAAFR